MSAGSGASNLGYGSIVPLSNINGNYANIHNSHNSANFGSNVISGLPGLSGAKNNIVAAAGNVPGICLFKGGGSKILKRKIKNITKHYKKMKHGSKRSKHVKRTLKRNCVSKKHTRGSIRHGRKRKPKTRRRQRGGYAQYFNNQPYTPNYQVAGVNIPANQSWAANPPPISLNSGGCVDNYNHYTGKGFPSEGH